MRFGQYELYERFAKGAMAELYLGRARGEEGFEKPVAIKRILPHLAEDNRFVDMLLTEASIHASLSHKNIVQIHDLGMSPEGEYFIVLEYVDGRDLGQLLTVLQNKQPNGMTDALALFVACEAGQGVHFAHEMRGPDGRPLGLVHRDISPSNLLLSYAGEVKLSDFGVAKRSTDKSVVRSLKGELKYMSPEQARGTTLDRRSDIFSLGAVLFEMLTGHPLRDFPEDVDCWQQVASGLVAPPSRYRPDLAPQLDDLLARALAPDPRDRFPDARAFVDACREAMQQTRRPPSGEAAELKQLLTRLLPPGSPRTPGVPSKVIRLRPDLWRDPTAPKTDVPAQAPAPPPAPVVATPRPTLAEAQSRMLVGPPQIRTARPTMPSPVVPSPQPGLVQPRRKHGWIVAVALGLATAAAFHAFVMPLPVAAVWLRPARVDVSSQPPGADLFLDGKPLGVNTPAQIKLPRDRRPHVIEVRKPGFAPAQTVLYLDRTVNLKSSLSLVPAAAPPPTLKAGAH
jgi:serine/threonine-protein kinase